MRLPLLYDSLSDPHAKFIHKLENWMKEKQALLATLEHEMFVIQRELTERHTDMLRSTNLNRVTEDEMKLS